MKPSSMQTGRPVAATWPAPPVAIGHTAVARSGIAPLILGGLLGASSLFSGLYDIGEWGLLALLLIAATIAAVVTRRIVLTRWGAAALGGMAGIAVLSGVSALWAESAGAALTDANRWVLYAVVFALGAAFHRADDSPGRLVAAVAVGAVAAAAVTEVRLLAGERGDMFHGGRLQGPLGYVNGQAAFLVLAIWPCLAYAAAGRAAVLRVAAVGAMALLASLLVLTASRGALLGLAVGLVVALVLPGGRRARLGAALLVLVAVAPFYSVLEHVYASATGPGRPVVEDAVRDAALGALGAAAAGCVLMAVALLVPRRVRATALTAAPFAVAAALVLALTLNGSAVAERAQDGWTAFRTNDTSGNTEQTRFGTAGSNRGDYWRVALEEFRERPLAGWGAGNYTTRYFALRETTEDVRQPHSLELQALAELGVLGGALLLLTLGGLVVGLVAAARRRSGLAVAAIAPAAAAWLTHTSLDWLHLIPGLTAALMLMLGSLAGRAERPQRVTGVARGRLALVAAAVLLAALSGASVVRLILADHFRGRAEEALADQRPNRAFELARSARRFDPDSMPAFYVQAAALARGNYYRPARAVLTEAAEAQPHNFVPHVLLGDLAVRRGKLDVARGDYQTASRLNPRDQELRRLARDPGSALR